MVGLACRKYVSKRRISVLHVGDCGGVLFVHQPVRALLTVGGQITVSKLVMVEALVAERYTLLVNAQTRNTLVQATRLYDGSGCALCWATGVSYAIADKVYCAQSLGSFKGKHDNPCFAELSLTAVPKS